MNYGALASTITKEMQEAIDLINNPEVEPEIRRRNFEILFREIGEYVYNVIYDMTAFDFDISYTTGAGQGDAYYGLAKRVSDSVVTGGADEAKATARLWLDDVISKAEYDSINTAYQSGQHPTVTRTEPGGHGKAPCAWCQAHTGTFIEPTREAFRRHTNCFGKIVVSGYKTRNGLLKNYHNPYSAEERSRRASVASRARWQNNNQGGQNGNS